VENKYSPQPLHTHSPLPRRRQLDYCTPCRRNPSVRISEAAQPALVFCPSGKHPGDSLVCELGGLGYFDVGLSVGVRAEKNGCVIVSLLGASGEMVEEMCDGMLVNFGIGWESVAIRWGLFGC
jgi:hypothetical protein